MSEITENQMTEEAAAPAAPETPAPADTPPQKRRRGRPPKNPESPQSEDVSSAPRPTKNKNKKSFSAQDVQTMGKQITGLHQMVALMTGIPELQIQPQEGDALAQAVVNVCDQYDLAIDGKTGAFIQLLGAAGMVYVPRYFIVRQRMAAQANAAAGNVVSG